MVRTGYVWKKYIPWKLEVQSTDLFPFPFYPMGLFIFVIIIRGSKIFYFCNPITLLTLEQILFVSIPFLLHISFQFHNREWNS